MQWVQQQVDLKEMAIRRRLQAVPIVNSVGVESVEESDSLLRVFPDPSA